MDIEALNNKKIDIFGSTFTIKIVDELQDEENKDACVNGQITFSSSTIKIARGSKGNKFTNNDMLITLLHELIHSIFDSGQYTDTSSDEPLVEWTARCLYSLIFNQKLFTES